MGGQGVCQNFQRILIRTVMLIECIQYIIRLFLHRACNHRSVGKAEVGVGRFFKVSGGDDFPHLLLPVASGEDADHLSILSKRGIKDYQVFTTDTTVENDIHTGIALKPVPRICAIGHICLKAPVIRVDSIFIHKANVVKHRRLCHFLQHFHIGYRWV